MDSLTKRLLKSLKEQYLREYFGENFKIDEYNRDYILETLNTHDPDLLVKKLKKLNGYNRTEFEEKEVIKLISNKKVNEEELKQLLDFYGYYVTKKDYDIDEDRYIYYICPKYSKNCTEFIFKECLGVCYHLCLTQDVDSILRNGLRCRSARYRYFPKRVYVIAVPIKDIKKIKDVIREVAEELGLTDYSKYSVIRVNLGSHGNDYSSGPDFYQDDAMNQKNTFFTYTNIPPQYVKNQGTLNKFIK